jgi:hypothetical protein
MNALHVRARTSSYVLVSMLMAACGGGGGGGGDGGSIDADSPPAAKPTQSDINRAIDFVNTGTVLLGDAVTLANSAAVVLANQSSLSSLYSTGCSTGSLSMSNLNKKAARGFLSEGDSVALNYAACKAFGSKTALTGRLTIRVSKLTADGFEFAVNVDGAQVLYEAGQVTFTKTLTGAYTYKTIESGSRMLGGSISSGGPLTAKLEFYPDSTSVRNGDFTLSDFNYSFDSSIFTQYVPNYTYTINFKDSDGEVRPARLRTGQPPKVSTLSGYDIVTSGVFQIDGYRGTSIRVTNKTLSAKVETDFNADGTMDSEQELIGPYFY